MVKQCAGALSTVLLAIKRCGRSFCACTVNQVSRAKPWRGQAVKAVFRWSKIYTLVAALDTVPVGVTPLDFMFNNTTGEYQ